MLEKQTPSLCEQLVSGSIRFASIAKALDQFLEDPTAEKQIQALVSTDLYRFLQNIGPADAGEILAMASSEQVTEFLDLAIWHENTIQISEALDWLCILAALPKEIRIIHFHALDIGLLGCIFKQNTMLYLIQSDNEPDIPEHPQGEYYRTIDGWFIIDICPILAENRGKLRTIIETLYEDDADEVRRLFLNLLSELPLELEEYALRWRNNRLQDLGFADISEAMGIYAYLDPQKIKTYDTAPDNLSISDGYPLTLYSTHLTSPSTQNSFLSRVLREITAETELRRIRQVLYFISNKCLSADHVSISDSLAAQESLLRLHWRLSLGLEHVCQGEVQQGASTLRRVALLDLARLGHSLVLDVAKPLHSLYREGHLGKVPRSLDWIDSPLKDKLECLMDRRPSYFDTDLGKNRPFTTLSDLTHAQTWVEDARVIAQLVRLLHPSQEVPPDITLSDLYRTMLILQMLEKSGPLSLSTLAMFLQRYVENGKLSGEVSAKAPRHLGNVHIPEHLLECWLDTIETSLGMLDSKALDVRFIDGVWLVEGP